MTGSLFILIFIASIADEITYAEIIGATIVAGLVIIGVTLLGITDQLAQWIPTPIVFGLLAGAILSLVADVFTFLGEEPIIVGSTFLTYLWGRRWLDKRIPIILPALIVGLVATALTSKFGQVSTSLTLSTPTITKPVFSLSAIAAITPVFVVLVILQSNLPSMIFLRTQDFAPQERIIHLTSGISTFLGAFLGPMGVSLSLPLTSLVGGAGAGEQRLRYQAVYYVGIASVLIGLLASVAAALPEIIPIALLLTLAGLSLADVLSDALMEITRGPLLIGPLFTFVIAVSDISLLGFGPYF